MSYIRAVIMILTSTTWTIDVGATEPALRRLHRYLLDDYVMVRPRINASEPVHVISSFELCNLMGLDGREGMLTSYGYFEHRWRDDFLVWDPADFDGVDHIRLLTNEVWMPDVGVFNSMSRVSGDIFRSMREFPLHVTNNGFVLWGHVTLLESSCDVDMTHFPFDEQTCYIHYGTLNSDVRTIVMDVSVDYVKSNYYSEDGEYIVASNSSYQKFTSVEGTTFSSMIMSLKIRRRPTYYILNMVLPCVVLSLLTSLAFCLPVSCGERVTLQITVILSFSIYQMMLTEYIPNHATKIPILSILMDCTMLVSALSLITNVFIVSLGLRSPSRPMTAATHAIIFNYLAKIACYGTGHHLREGSWRRPFPGKRPFDPELTQGINGTIQDCSGMQPQNNLEAHKHEELTKADLDVWREAADVLDKVFLMMFTLVFLAIGIYELVA